MEHMKSPGDRVCLGWGGGDSLFLHSVLHQDDIEEGSEVEGTILGSQHSEPRPPIKESDT